MLKPITIHKPKLLLVEGTHEEKFFNNLLDEEDISDVQVLPLIGKYRFTENLEVLTKLDKFSEVESIGLVRDADENFADTFASLINALANLGFPAPDRPAIFTDATPKVGVFVNPDNQNPGSLEDLCLASIANDPILNCAQDYMDCLRVIQNNEHPHKSKALVQVYLAKEPDGDIHMGIASERDIWNWDSSAFIPIRNFLKML